MAVKHPLGDLIAHVKEATGWSDEQIAARARSAGHQLTRQNVARMREHKLVSLKADTMAALAAGLRLPMRTVVRAALGDLGVEVEGVTRTPEEAVLEDVLLSDREKDAVLALLASLRGPRLR